MSKTTPNKRFGKQYIRYLCSYMTVLLIPLVTLTFFYSSRFMRKFYEEIYETVDLELIQTSTQVENQLDSMQNIVVQLALNGSIPAASTAENPLDLNPVITTLSGFTSASSFIEDIMLFIDGKDYMVTSTTTCKKDFYFNRILRIPELQDGDIQNRLLCSQFPLCIPLERLSGDDANSATDQVVVFSYPLFTDYQKYEGNTLFYVRAATIQNLISNKLQSYHSQIYILDQNGNLIITTGANDKMQSILPQLVSVPDSYQANHKVAIDNAEYIVRTYRSENNNWHYFAFIPDKQTTFSQVSSIMKEFLAAIVIIIILASFTIYFLQKINYAPMRRLRDKAKEISPEQAFNNEFETISHALDYLSIQNSSLTTKLADSLTAVLNERLYRLLSGDYVSRDDFNLDCSELELVLPHPYFVVSIFTVHIASVQIDTIAHDLKEQFQLPHVYYYLHNFNPNQIVFLLNLSKQDTRVNHLLLEVQKYASQTLKLLTTIGIGSCVDNTEDIALSYMEAVSALDYRFVKGNGTVIDIKEVLDPTRVKTLYPHQEFEILRNALLTQNEQNIRNAIQTIIEFMEQNQLPLYLARSICFTLIHMVNEHCGGQKQTVSNSPLELSGMETAQDIISKLHTWSNNLKELTSHSSKNVFINDVFTYLDGHCLNCNFSAYESAEYFGMTLPAFSKFFKDSTGQNVMDYTIALRIETSKRLLRTTELQLKEIAEQVGYYNLSSFTRRFKLHQGITPSEYRKIS